jgi:predicted enzyme related to lactoylglutathione lyase
MAIARLSLIALDCPNPLALAEFYQQITGGVIEVSKTSPQGWVRLFTSTGCDIGFQRDDDHVPPGWPNGSAQQLHLDFDVEDLDATEAAVLAVGAVKADLQPEPSEWRVFIDPAGHPFCLVRV